MALNVDLNSSSDEINTQISLNISVELMTKLTHSAKEQKIDLSELINRLLESSIDDSRN